MSVYLGSKLLFKEVLLKPMEHCLLFYFYFFKTISYFSCVGIYLSIYLLINNENEFERMNKIENHLNLIDCANPVILSRLSRLYDLSLYIHIYHPFRRI